MNMPLASFVATVLSWAVAALFVVRKIDALRRLATDVALRVAEPAAVGGPGRTPPPSFPFAQPMPSPSVSRTVSTSSRLAD